ncbi:DNA polymerase IV [Bartonella sp. HY761]|uniref:DNA polymerase IV n=1 Tax=Bartonella sp. HY761 TaxID=2979330 RepID=UPI00220DDEC7|nr:DNA polymerase IV [Bartonella sp. HY761]UXN05300.1 DNA polymerase IV [Bartonella sp. HY761]
MEKQNDFSTPVFGFCRDCLTIQRDKRKRCVKCGSPRIIAHDELYSLSIAHIDCDAFYASVEKRDRPELRDKPVIIGGGTRGVVSTCCYIARIYGVRSAMPMFKALEACPQAVVIPPDMAKYSKVGKDIRQMMLELTPLVEPLSIDEAFLDLHGTEKLHKSPPAFTLARFAKRIENEIGISVSIGLSYCKYLAKVASDLDKPRGFSIIGQKEALSFLATQEVKMIWGVGKMMAAKLNNDGIFTISQLQEMEEVELMRRYGVMGQRLFRLSRGVDDRSVEPENEMKSVSAERTFERDLSKREDLIAVLRHLSELVSQRLKKGNIAGQTVVLKLKTKDFKLRTRNRHLSDPTQIADRIFRVGVDLLDRELDGSSFRLLGIGVQQLSDDEQADPIDLVDEQATKRAAAETAIDKLRDKFGSKAVETGFTFGKNPIKSSKE